MPHPASTVDPAAHATHDTVLVAAYAAGDAAGAELEAATDLVAGCPACAALHHDLRVIAAALLVMPAPRRPRDFRLTPGQAASLHPAGWRRLFAPFAGPRFAFAAPLGSGLAALGIVGVLLAGPGLPMGGSTAGAAPAEGPFLAASPANDDGPVGVTADSAAPISAAPIPVAQSPVAQSPVTAPDGNAGVGMTSSEAPASGTDKYAAQGGDISTDGAPTATAPAEGAGASREAVRVANEPVSEQAGATPANVLLMALAAAVFLAGVVMAGLRVVSRRVA